MANIISIGGNPIVPAAVQNDSVTDAMLKQTGGVLEKVSSLESGLENVITIVEQPYDFRFYGNESVTLSVNATAEESLSYQWQFKRPTDSAWTNFNNAASATMTRAWLSWWDGYYVRCKVYTASAECYTAPVVGYLFNNPRLYVNNLEDGGFTVDGSHNLILNTDNAIRTIAPFYVESPTTLTAQEGYELYVAAYNLDFSYVGTQGWANTITLQSSYYVQLAARKAGGTAITVDDARDVLTQGTLDLVNYQSVVSIYAEKQAAENSIITGTENDKYIYTNVNVGASVSLSAMTAGNYTYAVTECSEGDSFTVTGVGGTAARVWAWLDGSNNLIEKSGNPVSMCEVIVAPSGARKLVLNSRVDFGYAWTRGESSVINAEVKKKLVQEADICEMPEELVSPRVNSVTQVKNGTACNAKGAIFKNGNAYCITYGENLDGTVDDYPRVTSSGVLAMKYKYFQLVDGEEVNVSYGTIAAKGDSYTDYNNASATFTGGCGLSSGNNGLQFFTSAYTGSHTYNGIANYGMTPCACTVEVDSSGVTFGAIKELTLTIDGVLGKLDVTRIDPSNVNYAVYMTTTPPYYDSNGWKWLIPVVGGFAYLTSSNGFDWTYVTTIKTSYQPACEVTCAYIDGRVAYAARSQWQNVPDGDYTYVGEFDSNGNILFEYRLTSKGSRPLLVKAGGELLLFYNSRNRNECDCLKITTNGEQLYFSRWFTTFSKCTWYVSCWQGNLTQANYAELYLVGNNNSVDANNGLSLMVMTLPANEPRNISDASYSVETNKGEDYGAYVTDEASGAVVAFADGADGIPVSQLSADIPYNSNGASSLTGNFAGKNLLRVTASSSTISGVTFTVNSDGTVHVSGTATENAILMLAQNFTLPGGSYRLTGSPANGGDGKWRIDAVVAGGLSAFDYGSGANFTLENMTTFAYSRIIVWSGQAVDFTFRPMIALTGVSDDTFEPYSSQSITVDFGTTIYGGTYDFISGELTETTDASGAQLSSFASHQLKSYNVKTLKGVNTMWCATSLNDTADMSVEYRADTKLYIAKVIAS